MTTKPRIITAIAVVGSRKFPKPDLVKKELDEILKRAIKSNKRLHIITGGAAGVDTWAADWAIANQVMLTIIPAEWNLFGKKAGYVRNNDIWDRALAGIAFWDGNSPGTQHSFQIAQRKGLKLKLIRTDEIDNLPW
jgi:hypothetical protein